MLSVPVVSDAREVRGCKFCNGVSAPPKVGALGDEGAAGALLVAAPVEVAAVLFGLAPKKHARYAGNSPLVVTKITNPKLIAAKRMPV
jgi:hypothetical protein